MHSGLVRETPSRRLVSENSDDETTILKRLHMTELNSNGINEQFYRMPLDIMNSDDSSP